MSEIYQNAYCTISADAIEEAALDLHSGMFVERDTVMIQPVVCSTKFDHKIAYDAGPLTYRMRALQSKKPKPGSYVFMPEREWASLSSSALSKRGWIVQERLLSQRILHFAKDQLHFTCCEMQASEIWARGHPIFQIAKPFRVISVLKDAILYRNGYLGAESLTEMRKRGLDHPYGVWYLIAHNYAATDLSRFGDKLVAISGVAKALQPYLSSGPDEYYAGVWRGSLPHALMWRAPHQHRKDLKLIRPQDNHSIGSAEWRAAYQAPSWSWASVNWLVLLVGPPLHHESNKILIDVVEIDVRPIADQFGQVEPGSSITLRGHTYNVSVVWVYSPTTMKTALKFRAEVKTGNGLFAKTWSEHVFPDERYIDGVTEDVSEVRAVPVLSSAADSQMQWTELLLLRPLGQNKFTRFGYLRLDGNRGHDWFESTKKNKFGRRAPGPQEIIKIL